MSKWLNTVTLGMPALAATNTVTVNPASSGTVLSGARFSPTAGRLLVVVAGGPLTQTTPSGWTTPSGGSAVSQGGVYVWWRTAAGSDAFSTTVNGDGNWPTAYTILEFAAGSTFLGSAASFAVSKSAGAGPTLTTSAGTKFYVAVGNQAYGPATGTPSFSAWGSSAVEFVDVSAVSPGGSRAGYAHGLAYIEDATSTSQSVATTLTSSETNTLERLLFAVQVAATATIPAGSAAGTVAVTSAASGSSSRSGSAAATVSVSTAAAGVVPGPLLPVGSPSGTSWTLDFQDEFTSTTLDTSKWVAKNDSNPSAINNVALSPANVSISGGVLSLQLSSSTVGAAISTAPGEGPTTGYLLPTNAYVEFRCYFPGDGSVFYNWPAAWASGTNYPSYGEIDVAEVISQQMTSNYHGGYVSGGAQTTSRNGPQVSGSWQNAFHVYGAYRRAKSVDIYFDGKLVQCYPTGDLGGGQCLLLNVGLPDGATAVTGSAGALRTDYVRTWLRSGAEPVLAPMTETFSGGAQSGAPAGWSQQTFAGTVAVDSSGRLAITTPAGYYAQASGVMWAAMEPSVDTDVTAEVGFSNLSEQYPNLSVRATYPRGDNPYPRDGYTVELAPSGNSFGLLANAYGQNAAAELGTAPFTFTAGVRVNVRLQAIGTAVKAKVWNVGSTEPAGWGISVTSTLVPTPGRVLVSGSTGGDSVARSATWDNFSVSMPGAPASGSAAASVSVSSAATGSRTSAGSIAGVVAVTSSATGSASPSGSAAASVSVTSAASGSTSASGSSAGSVAVTSSATGSTSASGSSSGSVSVASLANGFKSPSGGSAGSVAVATAASGSTGASGVSDGTVSVTSTADGFAPVVGGASGSSAGTVSVTSAASGSTSPSGSATGTVQVSGSAAGTRGSSGASSGIVNVSSAASGFAPTVGGASGSSTGSISVAADASGSRGSSGAAGGLIQVSAEASGFAPVLGVPSGSAAATVQVTSAGAGTRASTGSTASLIDVRALAAGVRAVSGSAAGAVLVTSSASGRAPGLDDGTPVLHPVLAVRANLAGLGVLEHPGGVLAVRASAGTLLIDN